MAHPALLPDIGTASYNGVQLTALFRSREEGGPEYARDRRSVKYHKITFTCDGAIVKDDVLGTSGDPGASTTDLLMLGLRAKLTQNGKPFIYKAKGFGSLVVNAPNQQGSKWDVAYGPHPELLSFQPLGAGRSALISWKVTIHLVEDQGNASTGRSPFDKGILSFVRNDDISYDDKGYMTYTVSGELEIASTVIGSVQGQARGGLTNRDFAKNYLQKNLDSLVPPGFKTGKRNFRMSDDQRICTFSYSWEEFGIGGLPVACTDADGEYSWGNTNRGFNQWQMNLRASYYVQKDVLRNSAYLRFLGLYRARNPLRFGVQNAPFVILTHFRGSEGLYSGSKRSDFEAGWLQTTTFANIMRHSSMWAPIADSDYFLWRWGGALNTQVGPQRPPALGGPAVPLPPLAPPGRVPVTGTVTGMNPIMGWKSWTRDETPNDVNLIIDPFHQPPGLNAAGSPGSLLNRVLTERIGDVDECLHPAWKSMRGIPNTPAALKKLLVMGLPSPEFSWLDWWCEVYTELDPGLAIHKPLPQNNDAADSLATLDYQDPNFPKNTSDYNLNSNSSGQDIVQRMATSTYKICLRGFAFRAAYPIPIPGAIKFNGVTPTPMNPQKVWRVSTSNISGIPIFQARWELWYQCSVPPKKRTPDPYPQNPAAHLQTVGKTLPQTIVVPDGAFGQPVQAEYTTQKALQIGVPRK